MLPINNNFSLPQNSFYNTISGTYADYFSAWDKWEKQALPGEERDEAVSRLKECLINNSDELRLDRLNLSSLPDNLPAQITLLNVSYNQLTNLPELPVTLKKLYSASNKLSELPVLPPALESLQVQHNELENLPALPDSLLTMNISYNEIVSLPSLPQALKNLRATRNFLTELPAFSEGNNPVVREYFFDRNQISHIPESILNLRNECSIHISDNPLSSHALQALQRLTSSPDYHGPRIYFSMSDGQQNTLHRPLADAVTAWFPENKQSDVSQIWHAFEHEEHANTFSAFLDRLSDTVSARNTSGFREQVAAWLEKLSASAELRQQSFAVAADATESCEDRVALTWNNLRKTLLVHQASEGLFDNDTGALLSLGREMFRLEILEDIARDKVRTLHFVDEIEVYLAFQTMLAEKLQLSTAVKEMRFYGVSGVTANDLRTAEATVRSREENEFTDWFSLWGPWHAVLKRTEADRWAQAEEQKYEMLENEYPQRVADRLKASGLSGDADAEREAGAQVMRETEQQIYRQLTDEVLALRLSENGSQLHHS
ncbi:MULTISPECIES: T3SS effector E3 ubiquitin-protein ligase IpaH9.8 [Enterobacteriaceae]|uniref:RING-type E3 ubiquitin transferase n=1 Tax=Shigella boydii TaxID=621 RepID=A0A7G6KFN7_SHIBO|nr:MULTISPECIES: T3SS effector E3 ubiquitin-protein ligase IpaH9.8 [Enterobacteriaceae]EFZ0081212.1 T3SS effector E3 ubiquitin-protein ligase IpaH9.8 [Shigella flexneri]EFF0551993.1 T3SS effector E3 ubiquitin-protein ligase IpaH9.8 [Escherichia coli]EFK6673282.1 T3SS effector E3 ubiquitin-protein ligase IpaH9.8 [Escherichia coli]EFL6460230.1 T3SS effector E3 ubiquitin-protein ligase IpaH9.8 [Escherichia coli]EFZ0032566.1 T3SS effector E3 ubiquitin-protein ligase IpaH9.8 [Shigella boydii]